MAKKSGRLKKVTELRTQAEALLQMTKRDVAAMPVQDVQQLVHELQVHQIELEMQNDELRRTQAELEAARDRYEDLYDFSPAGHLTLDRQGAIVEANLRAGTLLGLNRKELLGQPLARFVVSADQAILAGHCRDVVKSETRQTCELRLGSKALAPCWIYLESLAVYEESGPITHWRTALLDISERKRIEKDLDSHRQRLEGIISSAMDAIITVDEGARVVVFNRAAESMFRCQAADAIGQPFDRFIPERFRQAHQRHVAAFGRGEAFSRSMDRGNQLFGLRANGEEFPIEASISYVRVSGTMLFTVILRDITERKAAEEALRVSEAFTRSILNSLAVHVCVLDEKGVIQNVNDAWEEFARAHAGADGVFTLGGVGDNYRDRCCETAAGRLPEGQAVLDGIDSVLAGGAPHYVQEYACRFPDAERWFLMRVTPMKGGKGVVISHSDISRLVRIGLELENHILLLGDKQRELESLTGKLIEAQEQERKRIARELHDDFNQRLAALSVELETLERDPLAVSEPLARALKIIREHVGQLSDDLHDLAYKLHPSLLEHVGLEVAIRDHTADFTRRTGLPVTYVVRKVPEDLPQEVATNLFRVMQESLQNASKHAQATELMVRLSGSSRGVGLSVRDNGAGFDLEAKSARTKGLGLMSMQERARSLGGFLRIHSLPGEGTKVCAWIPYVKEEA